MPKSTKIYKIPKRTQSNFVLESSQVKERIKSILFNDGNSFASVIKEFPEVADLEEYALKAVGTSTSAFRLTSKRLQENPDFIKEASYFNSKIPKHVSLATYTKHPSLAKDIVINNGETYINLPSKIRNDIPFIISLCKCDGAIGQCIQDFPKEAYDNKDVIRALLDTANSFDWASDRLRDDEGFCKEAIDSNPESFSFISDRLKLDPDFVRGMIVDRYDLIDLVPMEISNFPELIGLHFELNPDFPNSNFVSQCFNKKGEASDRAMETEIKRVLKVRKQGWLLNHINTQDNAWVACEKLSLSPKDEVVTPWVLDALTNESLLTPLESCHFKNMFNNEIGDRKLKRDVADISKNESQSVTIKPKRRKLSHAY